MIIGLTGSIGTGKSTVIDIIKKDYKVIDADEISKRVFHMNEVSQKILEEFEEISEGTEKILNRKKIRTLIFSDKVKKKKLEQIIHPFIKSEILAEIDRVRQEEIVIVDIPLLFECGYEKYMDKIIVVCCDEELQVARIIARDNITKEEALMIINQQYSQDKKKEMSDYTIINNSSIKELKRNIDKILKEIKNIRSS